MHVDLLVGRALTCLGDLRETAHMHFVCAQWRWAGRGRAACLGGLEERTTERLEKLHQRRSEPGRDGDLDLEQPEAGAV